MRRVLAALFLALTFLGCADPPRTPEARARRIASQVWSPYCPGRLLSECTTRQAEELRIEIHERAARGDGDEQIVSWLRENYGDAVVADAARPAVWLVPLGLGLAAAIALSLAIHRWSRASVAGGSS